MTQALLESRWGELVTFACEKYKPYASRLQHQTRSYHRQRANYHRSGLRI